ncbi:SAM-dependent methyltransferase [Acinetobacter sp. ANC 4558]|uniref:class I SAM-dependent methyltransferase n=1 Tax=Acinetobacter sp. ANC 4558 TaxID=1977876 RepID=UPI000A34B690|nr:class I SAM-dependent methyltransferase [Acinetobacter sp. ANC 4558]OTG80413.1 SAM-dependent methyltransferase [Acinetobacter sp. ANC 4558]
MTQFLHSSAQKGFSSAAELYQQVRPSYPHNIGTWLANELRLSENSTLIDLGSGTGKFLPYLQQISNQVIAVEPITAMFEQLKDAYPNIQAVQAFSHNLPFSTHFADAICCAQSFHWFANIETLTELHRVLKDHGWLILIWNQRDLDVNWVKAIAELIQPFEGDTPRYHHNIWKNVFKEHALFNLYDHTTFSLEHHGTVEQVVSKRFLSTSFIAAMPLDQQQELKHKIEEVLRDYTQKTAQDEIAFPYITHVYIFQKIPSLLG